MEPVDIVMVGVGGQGIITMASVLAEAALRRGVNAIVAETHGLSQRGGSVIVHVRLGEAEAPLIMRGTAGLMLALDGIEAIRYLEYLSPHAIVVVDKRVTPPPLPGVRVPSIVEIMEALEETGLEVHPVGAVETAVALGNPRAANMYMLGYAAAVHGYGGLVGLEDLEEAVRARLKSPESNVRVLRRGYEDGLKAVAREERV